jgi:hypothetical protein
VREGRGTLFVAGACRIKAWASRLWGGISRRQNAPSRTRPPSDSPILTLTAPPAREGQAQDESSLADLFQAQLAIVLLDNLVALTGGVFKFIAVHDLHSAAGVLNEMLPLQDTSCQAHTRSICP